MTIHTRSGYRLAGLLTILSRLSITTAASGQIETGPDRCVRWARSRMRTRPSAVAS